MEEIKDILDDMCGVGEDKDYILNHINDIMKDNEKLKEKNEKLKDKLWDVEETIRVAIASRLSHWFPDEKMGDNEYAEDCDIANNLNGDDLVNMIDGRVIASLGQW